MTIIDIELITTQQSTSEMPSNVDAKTKSESRLNARHSKPHSVRLKSSLAAPNHRLARYTTYFLVGQ